MSKHRSEDYKISAVKYYLNNDVSLDDVCEIFYCQNNLYIDGLKDIKSQKKLKENEQNKSGNILVHGLISCKNYFNVWNRDVNGATNICRIAKNAINGIERPKYLCREKKDDDKVKKVVQNKANKSVRVVALTKS